MEPLTALLRSSAPPYFFILEHQASDFEDLTSRWREEDLTVRTLRGTKMRDRTGLFDEFAAALQFPWYFAENRDSFDECIADLRWIKPNTGYVLAMTAPEEVLADDPDDRLAWLIESLRDAAVEFSRPTENGGPRDRHSIPFHVVLAVAGKAGAVTERWSSSGADVGVL